MPFPLAAIRLDQPRAHFGALARVLLEKIGDLLGDRNVSDRPGPLHVHPARVAWAGQVRPRFASHDDPSEAVEVQATQRPKQRFCRDKQCPGPALTQCINTVYRPLVFNAGAHPYMLGPWPRPVGSTLWALSQDLVRVPGRVQHYRECPSDELVANLLMEQVRHRVDKYLAGLLPGVRPPEPLWVLNYVDRCVRCGPGAFAPSKSQRQRLCVTVAASLGNMAATCCRIPRLICPTNDGAHVSPALRVELRKDYSRNLRASQEPNIAAVQADA